MRKIFALFFLTFGLVRTSWSGATSPMPIYFEENKTVPIVHLKLVFDVGAIHDPAGRLGLSSLASEMLLRGTKDLSKPDFFFELERLGGSLGADVRQETFTIGASLLAENLKPFLRLLESALLEPRLAAEEFERLKRETINDLLDAKGNDAHLVRYHFQRYFFAGHPYGNPNGGTTKGIQTITLSDVRDFYNRHLGNPRIFGAGAADRSEIEAWVASLLQKLHEKYPNAGAGTRAPKPELAPSNRILLVDKPSASQSHVMIGVPGFSALDQAYYAFEIANYSFGGPSFSSRLFEELRKKRGWTYNASSGIQLGRQPRMFSIYFFPKTDDTTAATEMALKLFSDFSTNGITEAEYNSSKQSQVLNSPFNFDTAAKRLENASAEATLDLPEGFFRTLSDRLDGVSFNEVQPALQKTLAGKPITVVVVGNAKKLRGPLKKLAGFSSFLEKSYLEE